MITGVILAGGMNTRFPTLKGMVEVGGERIIERTLRIFRDLFGEVIISTNNPDAYFYLGERMVGDIGDSRGPMSGIYSSLINSKSKKIFVAACDMPFISPDVVRYISSVETDAGAVVSSINGRIHPLLGIYRKELISDLETYLDSGAVGLQGFIKDTEAFIIDEGEIRKVDPEGCSFVNINTPEDYKHFTGGRVCYQD